LIIEFIESNEFITDDKTLYYRTDDEFLIIFLRPCKYYAESAHDLMRRVADFKQKNASLLNNLLPEDEKAAFLENNVVNVMKNRDHKRRRVLLVNSGKSWDPSRVSADQMFRIFYLIHEAAILEPETQVQHTAYIINIAFTRLKPYL
jgi:retinaldehyde-binding protein 1